MLVELVSARQPSHLHDSMPSPRHPLVKSSRWFLILCAPSQVPEAEFLALEQALLVAEKKHAPVPTKTVLSQKTISACFAPKIRSAATPKNKPAVGASDSKKRKLPSSFAHQEVRAAPIKRSALCYTV